MREMETVIDVGIHLYWCLSIAAASLAVLPIWGIDWFRWVLDVHVFDICLKWDRFKRFYLTFHRAVSGCAGMQSFFLRVEGN